MLDLETLEAMPPHTIFAMKVVDEPRLYKGGKVRWLAKKGGIVDWAIYYHHAGFDVEYVKNYGDKCFTKKLIRELVPCTDEVFKKYRY